MSYNEIRDAIMAYGAGANVPVTKLRKKLGVSVGDMRNAVKILMEADFLIRPSGQSGGWIYRTDKMEEVLVDESDDHNLQILQERNDNQAEIISKNHRQIRELEDKLKQSHIECRQMAMQHNDAITEINRVSDNLVKVKAELKESREAYGKLSMAGTPDLNNRMILNFIEDMVSMGLNAIGEKK